MTRRSRVRIPLPLGEPPEIRGFIVSRFSTPPPMPGSCRLSPTDHCSTGRPRSAGGRAASGGLRSRFTPAGLPAKPRSAAGEGSRGDRVPRRSRADRRLVRRGRRPSRRSPSLSRADGAASETFGLGSRAWSAGHGSSGAGRRGVVKRRADRPAEDARKHDAELVEDHEWQCLQQHRHRVDTR
jgi:hypothetical protein